MPIPLALAIGLGAAAGKAVVGGIQAISGGIKSKKLAKKEPVYKIPDEVFSAQNIAATAAQVGMPEEQYKKAVQQGNRNAQFALGAAQDRRSGLGAIERIQQSQNDYMLGLASQDAQMRQQNQRFLYSAVLNTASYRDKQFANQWQSWANKYQQARAQVGAGMQNIVGAFDNAAGMVMNAESLGMLNGAGASGFGRQGRGRIKASNLTGADGVGGVGSLASLMNG